MKKLSGAIIESIRSRRGFLKAGTLTGAVLALGAGVDQIDCRADDNRSTASGKLKVKIAGYDYDRVQGLIDGRVQIEGCETSIRSCASAK